MSVPEPGPAVVPVDVPLAGPVPQYVPGEWLAVVAGGGVALLPPTTAADVVAGVWASLRGTRSLSEHLQALLGGGLAALPPFALVCVQEGRVHAVVRGDVQVEVTTTAGVRTVGTPGVSTWTEEVVADAVTVAVRAPGAPAAGDAAPPLPLLSGVVRAAGVQLDLRSGGTTGTPEAPAARAVAGTSTGVPTARRPGDGETARPTSEDHDGTTVLSSDVDALRRRLTDPTTRSVPGLGGPVRAPAAPAGPPARLRMSSGLVISLSRPVLLGRAPQVARVSNRDLPRLVTVASPNQDISRTHAEVRMEGEDVLVTDLRSTNGVLLLRQDSGPQRLHPGDPTVVEPGVVVDLGEGVTFVVERGT